MHKLLFYIQQHFPRFQIYEKKRAVLLPVVVFVSLCVSSKGERTGNLACINLMCTVLFFEWKSQGLFEYNKREQ